MDEEGALRLSVRLTPDEGARLLAEVDARRDDIIVDALRGRWYENADAYEALMRGYPRAGNAVRSPVWGPSPCL